jgi:hypothetical protein
VKYYNIYGGKVGEPLEWIDSTSHTWMDLNNLESSTHYNFRVTAVDSAGNAYLVGTTESDNFLEPEPLPADRSGAKDVFISKLDPFGDTFIYSTYLGGTGDDFGNGIAVDTSGSAYVVGTTFSNDFPTQSPIQAANAGLSDAFVSKLQADGSALTYSTYHGGSGNDIGNSIAVGSFGAAYVTGATQSANFPTQSPIQAANAGSNDAFVTKVNSTGTAPLVYSTYLGGSGNDSGNGIAVDISDNAYVTGTTESANFPTANAFQSNLLGTMDSFVTRVNSAGDTLVYSSYLGGSNDDLGNAIAVDGLGNAFVAGTTDSTNFPTKSVQDNLAGGNDGFVAKVQEAEVIGGGAGGGNEASGGSSGGDCFIATAASGSPMAWPVQLLSVIFIFLTLLCTALFVLFRRLKLRKVLFNTARVKNK